MQQRSSRLLALIQLELQEACLVHLWLRCLPFKHKPLSFLYFYLFLIIIIVHALKKKKKKKKTIK